MYSATNTAIRWQLALHNKSRDRELHRDLTIGFASAYARNPRFNIKACRELREMSE